MFCYRCGAKAEDGAVFCQECGASLYKDKDFIEQGLAEAGNQESVTEHFGQAQAVHEKLSQVINSEHLSEVAGKLGDAVQKLGEKLPSREQLDEVAGKFGDAAKKLSEKLPSREKLGETAGKLSSTIKALENGTPLGNVSEMFGKAKKSQKAKKVLVGVGLVASVLIVGGFVRSLFGPSDTIDVSSNITRDSVREDSIINNTPVRSENVHDAAKLFKAAHNGTAKSVEKLLRGGVDVNVQDFEETINESPNLKKAERRLQSSYVELRRIFGNRAVMAAPGKLKLPHGMTALMYAALDNSSAEVIDVLVKAGADMDIRDESGWTALMYAVAHNDIDVVKSLVQHGAYVNAYSDAGLTVLKAADIRESNSMEVVQILTEAGAVAAPIFRSDIFTALVEGNAADIKWLIRIGVDVDQQNKSGETPILYGALHGAPLENLKILLSAGADVNLLLDSSSTALMKAVQHGSAQAVKTLLQLGANVNLKDNGEKTALMYANRSGGSPEVVRSLLEAGADVDARDKEGLTALMFASTWGAPKQCIKLLIDFGSDVNAKDYKGWAAIDYANYHRYTDIIDALVEGNAIRFKNIFNAALQGTAKDIELMSKNGINVNARDQHGKTPLEIAVSHGRPGSVIEALVKSGADINVRGFNEQTQLMMAINNSNVEMDIVETLVRLGADLTLRDDDNNTVFDLAKRYENSATILKILNSTKRQVQAPKQDHNFKYKDLFEAIEKGTMKDVKQLIAAGYDVNTRNEERQTPLMLAAALAKSSEIIDVLVGAGASVYAQEEHGFTPLAFAATLNQNPEITKALLEAGSDVHAKVNKMTILMLAVASNPSADVTKALIKAGADVNAWAEVSVLMYAAMSNPSPKVIEALVQAGANINAQANDMTPLMFAVEKNPSIDVIKTLIRLGADVTIHGNFDKTAMRIARERKNQEIIAILEDALKQAGVR